MRPFLLFLLLFTSFNGVPAKAELFLHFGPQEHYYPHPYRSYGHPWRYCPAYENPIYYGLRTYPPLLEPVPVYPAAPPAYIAYPQIAPSAISVPSVYAATEPLTQFEAFTTELPALKISRIQRGIANLTEQLTQQIANITRTPTQFTSGEIAIQQYQVQGTQSVVLLTGSVTSNGLDFAFQATLNLESDQAFVVHVVKPAQSTLPSGTGNTASGTQAPKTLGDQPWYPSTQK